ncbi:MAG: ThuA domain-containing protein [Phycisphaerales bacterium]|nr:ThuA domain-containing protein [Phycisphaerales bacterium]
MAWAQVRLWLACMAALVAGGCAGRVAAGPSVADGVLTWRPSGVGGDAPVVVLVSGDEEYRSEEALPQLAAILSERHGCVCHVLFALDPVTGVIDPEVRDNIPGLELLGRADLLIIATRFRALPDEQMSPIDAYIRSGRPVLGLRTATHAFASTGTYEGYAWNHAGDAWEGGFGRAILGETWIAHHGAHGSESTRGIVDPGGIDHPILRGVGDGDIWGPTDVYRVRLPLPEDCRVLVRGEILAGMTAEAPAVADARNDPMMPIAWTRRMPLADGGERRVFTCTMGAASDLTSAGTRRLLVNATLWLLDRAHEIPPVGADVRLVGRYEPSAFGFGGYRRGVRPEDIADRMTP